MTLLIWVTVECNFFSLGDNTDTHMTGPSSCLRTFLLALNFLLLDPSVSSELRRLTSQVVTLGSSSVAFLTFQAEAKRKKMESQSPGSC